MTSLDQNPASFIKNPKTSKKLPEVVSSDLIIGVYQIADEADEKPELVKIVFELFTGVHLGLVNFAI